VSTPLASIPAPIWRRVAASVYDGLLLIALWMVILLFEIMIRDQLLGLPRSVRLISALELLAGLAFFGWFWIHGGQTLGMRAWRLQVQRLDGRPLRWPVAATRFAALLLTWFIVCIPAATRMPIVPAHHPHAGTVAVAALIAAVVIAVTMQLDPRRRAPCDRIAGTEVLLLPKQAG